MENKEQKVLNWSWKRQLLWTLLSVPLGTKVAAVVLDKDKDKG